MLSSPSKADPCGVPHMTLPSQPEDKPSSLTRQSEPGRMLDPYENTKAAHARACPLRQGGQSRESGAKA